MREVGALLGDTISAWAEDNAFRLAAALAYYAVFSLAPLLIIVIFVVGSVWGDQAAQSQVIGQIQDLIGPAGAQAVRGLLENASQSDAKWTASWLGIVSLVFGATGVFVSLQDGLNTVWHVKQKPQNFVVGFIRNRLHTFTMVLGICFLLLISLMVSAGIEAAAKHFGGRIGPAWLLEVANSLVSFAIVTLLFAMIFKFVPDVEIDWSEVWIGAAVTALLFTAGKFAIGKYVGRSSYTSVYGAAGSIVLILAWVYYSSLILCFGAEFTRVYAYRYGGRIAPKRNAMPLPAAQKPPAAA